MLSKESVDLFESAYHDTSKGVACALHLTTCVFTFHDKYHRLQLRDIGERVGIDGGVRVMNPLTPDEVVLRQSLLPGMLRALAFNADRRQGDTRLFEVGHVFPPPGDERVARALTRSSAKTAGERLKIAKPTPVSQVFAAGNQRTSSRQAAS